ncbi:hypothetical protein [Croceibacter atlanticus]|jgi:hypothetical protein|uniref:Uncharacterized protein n=1 Tax=Croceibacter atlanticus (strain ATCC BAA-628 / JCM 21780 / CIP 108009 / IAM 15332 / KCTC 12090 / HTCC2559) TaxID=216432 RepID=A3U937_CROAH|nr:hypothetical protein [Croceibacter atlanticus]EAP86323.1 hypothetical protein CA2559_09823 [Croceibacter atlanticus HTCC2559]
MKIRKTIIFFLTIVTFSCQTELEKNKHAFQNTLGENKINAINSLVTDFENNLKKNYPKLSIDKAYEQYLTEIISDSTTDFEKFKFQTPNTKSELTKSGLWNEIYLKDNNNGLLINVTGQYMRGLNYVAKSDKFVKKYYEKRQTAGMMSNELVVNGILNSNPDFNNYFHKRIVVLEFTF